MLPSTIQELDDRNNQADTRRIIMSQQAVEPKDCGMDQKLRDGGEEVEERDLIQKVDEGRYNWGRPE